MLDLILANKTEKLELKYFDLVADGSIPNGGVRSSCLIDKSSCMRSEWSSSSCRLLTYPDALGMFVLMV